MTDITKATDDDIKQFLKGKTETSGFSFENKVAKMLIPEFEINREIPYFDKDENKGRTFDILARQFFPDDHQLDKGKIHSLAQINLIIECKDVSGDIWVFSLDKSPGIALPSYASMNYGTRDPAINVMPKESIENIPYVSAYYEYVFDEGKSNKQKNLFSAIHTVTKATHHQKSTLQNTFKLLQNWNPTSQNYILHFGFFQPVIVFSGKLYVVKYVDETNPEFEPVKYVQLKTGYISKDYNEISGEIHIVSIDALPDYIGKVKRYYRQNENTMVSNQKIFLKALKTIMPNLQV